MFPGELQKRLDLLDSHLIVISDSQIHIDEKREQGRADLTLNLQNPCILFMGLEEHRLGYFKNKKCADHVMFEQKENDWILHIFEMKRSVGEKEWKKIKEQFRGAIQNALALAGFLDITIDLNRVCVYSVYRNDKLNDVSNPVKLRYQMHDREPRKWAEDCRDWNEDRIRLDFLNIERFRHNKIPLDVAEGTGTYNMR